MKNLKWIIGNLATLAIPAGLILWLFWAEGWKVSVIGLVIFMSMAIYDAVVKLNNDK